MPVTLHACPLSLVSGCSLGAGAASSAASPRRARCPEMEWAAARQAGRGAGLGAWQRLLVPAAAMLTLCCVPAGRLVRLTALEGEPVADDPHVPLPHGALLPHVVGVPAALGRPAQQPAPAAPGALPVWHGPADAHPQPVLDPQEDAAAPPPSGLELHAAAVRGQHAPQNQRPRAPEEGAVAARAGCLWPPLSRRRRCGEGAVGLRDCRLTRCVIGVGFPGATKCLRGGVPPCRCCCLFWALTRQRAAHQGGHGPRNELSCHPCLLLWSGTQPAGPARSPRRVAAP